MHEDTEQVKAVTARLRDISGRLARFEPVDQAELDAFDDDVRQVLGVPMHCTEFVPGDPSGCARCGEAKDLHDSDTRFARCSHGIGGAHQHGNGFCHGPGREDHNAPNVTPWMADHTHDFRDVPGFVPGTKQTCPCGAYRYPTVEG